MSDFKPRCRTSSPNLQNMQMFGHFQTFIMMVPFKFLIFFSNSNFGLDFLFFLFSSILALKVTEGERQVIIGINYHWEGRNEANTTIGLQFIWRLLSGNYKQISKEGAHRDQKQALFWSNFIFTSHESTLLFHFLPEVHSKVDNAAIAISNSRGQIQQL